MIVDFTWIMEVCDEEKDWKKRMDENVQDAKEDVASEKEKVEDAYTGGELVHIAGRMSKAKVLSADDHGIPTVNLRHRRKTPPLPLPETLP